MVLARAHLQHLRDVGCFRWRRDEGIIAFREGWIDQLYVLPEAQRRGVGKDLLQVAQNAFDRLQLWTFQRNAPARRFYKARGFALIQETDGAGNEEKEPDALYSGRADKVAGRLARARSTIRRGKAARV